MRLIKWSTHNAYINEIAHSDCPHVVRMGKDEKFVVTSLDSFTHYYKLWWIKISYCKQWIPSAAESIFPKIYHVPRFLWFIWNLSFKCSSLRSEIRIFLKFMAISISYRDFLRSNIVCNCFCSFRYSKHVKLLLSLNKIHKKTIYHCEWSSFCCMKTDQICKHF